MGIPRALANRPRHVYSSAPMFFLTPRHVKYGREFARDARKLLAYKRDLLSEATIADFEKGIAKLDDAVKARESRGIEEAAAALDTQCGAFVKPQKDAGMRENCEVFLVAIVVALGVRTYFLQPFTIPTGSMFPTLNGIIGTPMPEPSPNIVTRIAQFAWHGRTYVDVVAKSDDVIREIREVDTFPLTNWDIPPRLATRTLIVGERSRYVVDCPIGTLRQDINPLLQMQNLPLPVHAGEPIARGYFNTGDHVFVDKISYHFRTPKRGEVFVFNTHKIPTQDNRGKPDDWPSQYYIKRLAGAPCDTLQVKPPELFINGKRAEGHGFETVMAAQGKYRGYSNGSDPGNGRIYPMNLLRSPEETVTLDAKSYFAMGDNSFHSSDSRDWGFVPQQNIMGRGVFVYWPFRPHFGLIR